MTINQRKPQNIFKYFSRPKLWRNCWRWYSSDFSIGICSNDYNIDIYSFDSNIDICSTDIVFSCSTDLDICSSNNIVICFSLTYRETAQKYNKSRDIRLKPSGKILFPNFYFSASKNGWICKICSSFTTGKGDQAFVERPGNIGDHPSERFTDHLKIKRQNILETCLGSKSCIECYKYWL